MTEGGANKGGSLTPITSPGGAIQQPMQPSGGLARGGGFGLSRRGSSPIDQVTVLKAVATATPAVSVMAICGTLAGIVWMITQTNPAVISVKQQEASAKQVEAAAAVTEASAKAIESASPKCFAIVCNTGSSQPAPQVAQAQLQPQVITYETSAQTHEQANQFVWALYATDPQRFYARAWELRPAIRQEFSNPGTQSVEAAAYNRFFVANLTAIPEGF